MKRDEALASLSRDHHQTLVVAQRLRRADAGTAAAERERFLAHWTSHAREHFRIEEEVLLPAFAAYGDAHDPLVLRTLGDHVAIRQRADALADNPSPPVSDLHALGKQLADHVRLEERELFPLIEQAMPPDALTALATRLDEVESLLLAPPPE